MDDDMYICLCADVNARQVREAIEGGAETLEDIAERTAACTGCGSCQLVIYDMLTSFSQEEESRHESSSELSSYDDALRLSS